MRQQQQYHPLQAEMAHINNPLAQSQNQGQPQNQNQKGSQNNNQPNSGHQQYTQQQSYQPQQQPYSPQQQNQQNYQPKQSNQNQQPYPSQQTYSPQQNPYPPQQQTQQNYMPQQAQQPYQNNQNQNPPIGMPQNYQQSPQAGQMIAAPMQQGVPVVLITQMRGQNAFQKLSIPGVFIKQKFELIEALSGCEQQNKYTINTTNATLDKPKKKIFKAKEKSGWCERNCLSGECRPFKIMVLHDTDQDVDNDGDLFLEMERKCSCTFYCLNRPELIVTLKEGGANRYLGKVIHTFTCCTVEMEIKDDKDLTKYILRGTVCQIGLYRLPLFFCKDFQMAFFPVFDPTGKQVGLIEKKGQGCKSIVGDSDSFIVLFPLFATLEDRALLMACSLLLDFRFFEEGPGKSQNTNL